MSTHETDRSEVCRICTVLTAPEASSNLFECRVADGYSLAEVVALVGDIAVRADETGLSAWCCFQCQMDVEMAYRVRVLCQQSDRQLREMLEAAVVMEPEGTFELGAVWKMEVEEPALGEMVYEENHGEQIDYDEEAEAELLDLEEESSNSQQDKSMLADVFEEIPNTKKRCCGCHKLFDSVEEILEHSKREHAVINPPKATKDRDVCDICFRFMEKRYLESHKETPKTLFRCRTCGEHFFTQKQVTRHYFNEHASTKTCCGCELTFDTEEDLRLHSDQVHLPHKCQVDKENPNQCNICYQTFSSDLGLYIHRSRQGSTEEKQKYKCSKCPKQLSTQEALQFHEYGHQNPFSWKCTRCAEVFTDYSTYKTHASTHKAPRLTYVCETCGLEFRYQILLHKHEATHGGPKKFNCQHCPSSYTQKRQLTRHMNKVHQDIQTSTLEGDCNSSEKEADDDLDSMLDAEQPKAPEI
ncbi:zinc finger protein 761-like [Culex quinquefasciatus]|uniref:zinc finger protein 761-like n=1 Tax=Culex quinquefasciatus TaxID=7176 RepID=UPI0018E2BCB0|nr:zinc finger protein 761-like [Culex quinquefasciatus]